MVLGKLMGIADLAMLACISLVFFGFSPGKILMWGIFYFGIKCLIFRFDFNSWIDLGIALYAILLIIGLKLTPVYVCVLLYLGQKGLVSLA